jgi:predicted ATPase
MIGDRELLVVLDNCEHVITAAAEVAEALLQRCPGLRLVATSREGLRVPGETVWPVPPLADGDASRLFVERARASGAPVELTDDTSSMIHDICRRLDGLPLAIELAAARTRAFPIAQIASRLNDRFRLLTGGARTALPRQQTLRAVVDWSYDLLFEDEQRVFERLAVFPGGCDLAAAEVVCADDTLDPDDVHDVIEALVEKSLVIAVPTGAGLRFTQLQTLAHYGREKLAERGEAEKTRGAMAAYFKALCAESATAYIGDRQRMWLTAIDQEQDNLRAALEWAVDTDDAETALTIAGGASWPHWLAGTIVEGRRWIDAAFACAGEMSDTTRALGLVGRGLLEFLSGAPQRADADLEQALQTFQAHDDFASTALAFSFYAEFAAVRGEVDEARRRRQAALDHYAEMPDDHFYVAVRSFDQGKLAVFDGDLAGAEAHYRAAAEGFAQVDRPVMLSISLGMVADFDERAGDHAAAIRVLDQAIATNQAVGLRGFTGSLLVRLGWSLLHVGDLRRAQASYEQALEGARRTQNGQVVFFALAGLAVLHRSRGEDGEAAAMAAEALEIHLAGSPRRFRNRIDPLHDVLTAAAAASSVLAVLAAEGGDGVRAARLLGLADQLRAGAGASLPPFLGRDTDRAERLATDALGQEAFRAALEEGRRGELGLSLANPA